MKQQSRAAYICQIVKGAKKTTDLSLAMEAAQKEGRAPIEFISPRVREAFSVAYPYLMKKMKKSA